MLKRIGPVFAALCALALVPALCAATVPFNIGYQGYLADTSGAPVTGSLQMTFRLYTVPAGGTAVWTETQTVGVVDGVYAVLLGKVTPLDTPPMDTLGFNTPYYLSVQVGADGEMTPRSELGSVAYALNAHTVDGLHSSDLASSSHGHNHSSISDDQPEKHRLINDAGTGATELWSASKIGTDLAGKADTGHGHLHSGITDDEAGKHRMINDAGTGATELWSAGKIDTALSGKAAATHAHSGADITSGTVGDAYIPAPITRDSEVIAIVTEFDGTGSGVDSDFLDGQHGAFYQDASNLNAGTIGDARLSANVAMQADISGLQDLITTLQGQVVHLSFKTGTAVKIEKRDNESYEPRVAMDASGNAIAAWVLWDGLVEKVYAARYTPAAGWGAPAAISGDDGSGVDIAMSPSGDAVAVWQQVGSGVWHMYASLYSPSTGWGAPDSLEVDTVNSAGNADVAMDASGNAVAVWSQSDGTRDVAYANVMSAGIWGGETPIDTAPGDSWAIKVAMDGSGNAVAVWQQGPAVNSIHAAVYDPGGAGWGSAVLIETDDSGNAEWPQVAMDSSGDAIAVWQQNDGTRYNINSNRYQWGVGWGAAAIIDSEDLGDAYEPQIGIDASGNAVVVWQQSDLSYANTWGAAYDGTWGTPVKVESDPGDTGPPQVAVNGAGNAVAVWRQYDGARYGIRGARFSPLSGWGAPAPVESDFGGESDLPKVSIDPAGEAIGVWQQWVDPSTYIWAKLFP